MKKNKKISEIPPPAPAIEHLPPDYITEDPNNARRHTPEQIATIAESIRRFGFNQPIAIDDFNIVLAGHGRLAAAKKLHLPTVPCLRVSGLSENDRLAYAIASPASPKTTVSPTPSRTIAPPTPPPGTWTSSTCS